MSWPGSLLGGKKKKQKNHTNTEKQITLPFMPKACYSKELKEAAHIRQKNNIIKQKQKLSKKTNFYGDLYGKSTLLFQIKLHNFFLFILHQFLTKHKRITNVCSAVLTLDPENMHLVSLIGSKINKGNVK